MLETVDIKIVSIKLVTLDAHGAMWPKSIQLSLGYLSVGSQVRR